MNLGFDALGFSALSETPETRWTVGGEATAQLDWGVRIFAATHDLITRGTDTPPDQVYLGTLEKAFRLDRSIIGSNRIGEELTIGFGEVTLANSEHDYDFLAVDTTPLGQQIEIKYGDRRRPHAEWRTVLKGYMTDMQIDRDSVTFRMRDAGHNLDVPASPNIYLGTGGTEGTEDLKNIRKPRVFGWVSEWTAPLVIPSALAYQLNDGQIQSVSACRVRGVAQVFNADYATVALLNAASLGVGEYATCLAAGWGRIGVAGGTELGHVTWDFAGDKTGGTFVATTSDIVRRVLTSATILVDPDDLVVSTFDALNVSQPAPVGYGVPAGDEQTVAALVAALMAGIGGWGGARRNGKFEVRRFEAPGADVPSGVYDRLNLGDVKLGILPSDISPPPWRVRVGFNRVWTTGQTDLAGSVSDTYRAFLAQDVRFAAAEDASIRNDFPPGHELIEDKTYFRDEADALAEANRKLELFGEPRNLYSITLMDKLFVHELGQVVSLQFDDRFDLEEERIARIVKISEDDHDGVELTVFA